MYWRYNLDEYRKYIETDGALDRRFQKVMIEPPQLMKLFRFYNIKFKYEEHHHVKYSIRAIESAVRLSDRYITDRHLPDKAIDVLMKLVQEFIWAILQFQKKFLILKKKLKKLRQEKAKVVKRQDYEEAARLRDKERNLQSDLEIAKREWEAKTQRYRSRC